jgi:hypothetical protein
MCRRGGLLTRIGVAIVIASNYNYESGGTHQFQDLSAAEEG